MKSKSIASILFVLILFNACSKSNGDENKTLEGQIIDNASKAPLHGAQVMILENGPIKTTDQTGSFTFSEVETTFGITGNDDVSNLAVSVSLAGYFTKEVNVVPGKNAIIEIAPDTSTSYTYSRPVQLNDGFTVGTLSSQGMDTVLMQKLMEKLKSKKYKQAHSLLIYKGGNLILEEYFSGNDDTIDFENNVTRVRIPGPVQWGRTKKHYVASVNKALTSTVVGIVLDAKGKTVDDKISTMLPDYQTYFADPNKAAIDIENCLTMTLGFQWDEWASNDLSLLWKSDNFATFLLNRPNNGPDSEWKYCSASPNLLLRCMENLVGGSIRDWADQNFYAKLGITDYAWGQQPDGLPEGAARMFIRPRDMLKVGVTYLNNGKWNGTQVIPAKWVEECFKVKQADPSGDYSYYFWIRTINGITFLSADGDGGNYINIIPSLDMVIVITQGNYLEWPLYVNQATDMMKNYIFPAAQ